MHPNHITSCKSAYACVQKLTQSASVLFENRQYDRAILLLTKSLQLWKKRDDEVEDIYTEDYCHCRECTNLKRPRHCFTPTSNNETEKCASSMLEQHPPGIVKNSSMEYDTHSSPEISCGYMHSKLVQIPCRKRFGEHNIDSAVALILISNLAIAHHKSAVDVAVVEMATTNGAAATTTTTTTKQRLRKALLLYELAYDCLHKYHDSCGLDNSNELCILFTVIHLNNIGHLHWFSGDYAKSQQCIQHLISVVMCVMDRVRNIDDSSNDSRNDMEIGKMVCMDGLFRNITPIVLSSHCAEAA